VPGKTLSGISGSFSFFIDASLAAGRGRKEAFGEFKALQENRKRV
jgi:hypothetical protein